MKVGEASVYYVNKVKATQVLAPTGNLISSTAKIPDGFVQKITDKGSHVKLRLNSVTETQQFKRWFGNWQKHPGSANIGLKGTIQMPLYADDISKRLQPVLH